MATLSASCPAAPAASDALVTLPIPLWQRAVLGYWLALACAAWTFYAVRPRPVGSASRLLLTAPSVALLLGATPFLLDRLATTVLITPVTGMFSLMAFKAAAYAAGRGPLVLMETGTFAKFAAVLCMPVIPRAVFCVSGGSTAVHSAAPATALDFLRMYGAKAAGAAAAAAVTQMPHVPVLAAHWFYALCLSLTLGAIWDFWCLMALVACGVEVAPSFDKPWLSTSFADYWSRRWNLTVTYMLRVLVYEPVVQGSLVAPPSTPAALQQQQQQQQQEAGAAAAAPWGLDQKPRSSAPASRTSSSCSSSGAPPDAAGGAGADAAGADARLGGAAGFKGAHAPEGADSESDIDSASAMCSAAGPRRRSAWQQQDEQKQQGQQQQQQQQQCRSKDGRRPSLLRRYAALQATFAFSGAWHALIFYYNTGLWTWHWFAFFTVQAPIVTLEALLIKRAKAAGWQLPRLASILLTNFLLIVVANPLFFGPCDWSGLCTRMMNTFRSAPSTAAAPDVDAAAGC